MDVKELKEQLLSLEVYSRSYSLDGTPLSEAHILDHVNGKWETYYSERGLKQQLIVHETEGEACEYLFQWILKDPTVFQLQAWPRGT